MQVTVGQVTQRDDGDDTKSVNIFRLSIVDSNDVHEFVNCS